MEIKFNNCIDDYFALHEYLSKNEPSYRKIISTEFVVMFLLFQSISFNILMLLLYFNIGLLLFWILVIPFNISLIVNFKKSCTKALRSKMLQCIGDKPNFIECEKRINITPDKVYYLFGAREGNVPWRLIDDVAKLDNSIVIKEEKFKFIIPLRFFSDVEQFNEFYDESRNYWENNREEPEEKPDKRPRKRISKRKIVIYSFIALFIFSYILLLKIMNPQVNVAEQFWVSSFKEGNLEYTYNHSTLDFKNRISFDEWSKMIKEQKSNIGLFQDYKTIGLNVLSDFNQISNIVIIKSVVRGEKGKIFIRTLIKRENNNYLLDGFEIMSPTVNKLSYMSESDQEKSKPFDWSSDDFDSH